MAPKRLLAIACEIAYREMCLCVATSRNIVDLRFLTKGLHDLGSEKMVARLQDEVDAADAEKYEAVLLAYGLCNNGVAGLTARALPLVIPRAHDCITFFFGTRERYREYFDNHPGTYFATTGWQERDAVNIEDVDSDVRRQLGYGKTYEDYVAEHGEENAKYIMETLGDGLRNYDRLTYIDMGVQENLGYDEQAARDAEEKGWTFERVAGDLGLLRKLVDGEWGSDVFLVVEPGETVAASHDDGIIKTG